MQPRWLPVMRASIGFACVLAATVGLAWTRPWEPVELVMVGIWVSYGVFLIWVSRWERSGTRVEQDAVVVTAGRRVQRLTRADILDLRLDQPPPHAWRVQAVVTSGERVTLLAVPVSELDGLRRWHVGGG